ncbi:hypothetical protein CsSME_00049640 [Camellia sinensis var. sinensis]
MQPVPFGVKVMSINKLKCLVKDFLQQRRYMVVSDDVWNVNAWDSIKYVLADNNSGSRVILTTRFAYIASTYCEETEAISGVLVTKGLSRIDEWEMLYRNFGTQFKGNDKLERMKKALSLSYNGLPYHMKICPLYLSIFPEDQQILCNRLIQLWTTKGFVNATNGKTIEEVAEDYLNELFNRSLVQVT